MKKPVLCISCDLILSSGQYQFILKHIRSKYPDYEFDEIRLEDLKRSEFKRRKVSWSRVIIVIGDYSIKRYFKNCWPFLSRYGGSIKGINMDGHIFDLPRTFTLYILIKEQLKQRLYRLVASLYEVAYIQ